MFHFSFFISAAVELVRSMSMHEEGDTESVWTLRKYLEVLKSSPLPPTVSRFARALGLDAV